MKARCVGADGGNVSSDVPFLISGGRDDYWLVLEEVMVVVSE